MSIKRLLKKYNRVRQKAIKLHQKIETYYEKAYLDNDREVCFTILNQLYGTSDNTVMSLKDTIYSETDSIIYSDFNKKQEI